MLEIYYKQDIGRILLALASAGEGQGLAYIKALRDVGLAFGLGPQQQTDPLADDVPAWYPVALGQS